MSVQFAAAANAPNNACIRDSREAWGFELPCLTVFAKHCICPAARSPRGPCPTRRRCWAATQRLAVVPQAVDGHFDLGAI